MYSKLCFDIKIQMNSKELKKKKSERNYMWSNFAKKWLEKPKFCLNVKNIKMKQIRNDYSYISIKIRPLATFSRKVEKNCFKIVQWDSH